MLAPQEAAVAPWGRSPAHAAILLEGALRHSRLHSSAEQPTIPLIPVHGARYVEEVILAAHSRRSRERVAFGAGTWHSQEAAVSVKCGAEDTENTVRTWNGQLSARRAATS